MNRGEPLNWGITIETIGTQWTVRLAGSLHGKPDWYFDTWDELTDWLEDQHEGWKISRLGGQANG